MTLRKRLDWLGAVDHRRRQFAEAGAAVDRTAALRATTIAGNRNAAIEVVEAVGAESVVLAGRERYRAALLAAEAAQPTG